MASYEQLDTCTVRGHDPKDKRGWDGETFPYYEPTKAGFVVHCSKSVTLPGVYTDERLAVIGWKRYRGKVIQSQIDLKAKREAKRLKRNKKG